MSDKKLKRAARKAKARNCEQSVPLSVLRGGVALEFFKPQSSPVEKLLLKAALAVGEIAGGAGRELSRFATYQCMAYWLAEQNVELAALNDLLGAAVDGLREEIEKDDALIAAYKARVAELEAAAAHRATLTTV